MKMDQILFADGGATMPLFPWFQYASYLLDLVFLLMAWAQYANIKNQLYQWMTRLDNSPSGGSGSTFSEEMWQTELPGGATIPPKSPLEKQRTFLSNHIAFLYNLYLMLATIPFLFGFMVSVLSRYQKETFKEPEYWTIIFGFLTSVIIMAIYLLNFKKSIHQINKIFDKLNLQPLENGTGTEIQKKLVDLKNENTNLKNQLEESRKRYLPPDTTKPTNGDTDPGKPEVRRGNGPPC